MTGARLKHYGWGREGEAMTVGGEGKIAVDAPDNGLWSATKHWRPRKIEIGVRRVDSLDEVQVITVR